MRATITGITASLEDDVGVVPADGEGEGEGEGSAADGLDAAGSALALGAVDGATLGLGEAATIVKVVSPWAMSPSSADAVVHRTV